MTRKPLSNADKAAAINLRRIWDDRKDALGLTQDSAADKMGFGTQGAVSHYLNGYTPLNTDAVLKFAALLKVSPTEIRPDLNELLAVATKPGAESDVVNEFAAVYAASNDTWRTFLKTSILAAKGAMKEKEAPGMAQKRAK